MFQRRTLAPSRRRRATTMTEMVISAGIFSIIAVFVTVVTIAIGKQSKNDLMTAPAEAEAYRALDFIRSQLLRAQYGTVKIWNDNRRITYLDPNTGSTCSIVFDNVDERIVFCPEFDVKSFIGKNEVKWGRGISGTFELTETPKRVQVTVSATGKDVKNRPMVTTYTDVMTIRN